MTSLHVPDKLTYWFIFQNERLLIVKNSEKKLLLSESAETMKAHFLREYRLSHFDDFDVYCAEVNNDLQLPNEFDSVSLRQALEFLGPDWYTIAARAYSIITWDKNHRHCGRCGNVTVHKPDTFERICTTCSLSFYPRISPSIIVLIHQGDQILMARGSHFPPGVYGLIAGFIEAGENIEEAAHREVQEEIGIKIKNLRYFGSQSWPFPDSLMIGFIAEYASGELVINHDEIEAAGWYRFDNLPGKPSTSISIARKLINYFIAEQMKK